MKQVPKFGLTFAMHNLGFAAKHMNLTQVREILANIGQVVEEEGKVYISGPNREYVLLRKERGKLTFQEGVIYSSFFPEVQGNRLSRRLTKEKKHFFYSELRNIVNVT